MPFISQLLAYRSVSIVGLEKNTGKTETLNYVIGRLGETNRQVGVTSIGIDGEGVDQVTQTSKPEIYLPEGMIFTTSEQHYAMRKLTSEVLQVSNRSTALGRLVTARVKIGGKVLLSGPSDTASLQKLLEEHRTLGVSLTLVDGALSRMSLASPTVTESMILATGAAYSANMNQMIKQTCFICDLIEIDEVEPSIKNLCQGIENGIWSVNENGELIDLKIPSVLMFEKYKSALLSEGNRLFVVGVVTDKLLNYLRLQKLKTRVTLIVKDFSRLFLTPSVYYHFIQHVGDIYVLQKTNLIALTVNPTSPQGYVFNSAEVCERLSVQVGLPVYNVREL